MQRTILFDLDGTLVDTLPDLTASLNRVLGEAGLKFCTPGEVRAMIGDGMPTLLTRALAGRDRRFDAALLSRFLADYFRAVAVASKPYPGTPETLRRLSAGGWRMAVATNKPEAAARQLLQALGLEHFFSAVGGGDSFPVRKPDPEHLLATLRLAGGNREYAAMLGDHANDVAAARAAGMAPLFALWGYGRKEMADGAEIAQSINEIPEILEGLVKPVPVRP